MNTSAYYRHVISQIRNCFQFSHYVIAAGEEFISQDSDPVFPAIARPIEQLENLILPNPFQIYIPIVGERSQSVLMPIDFEIFLGDENDMLYQNPATQKTYFDQMLPIIQFLETFFRSRGMPYILDYTPSGIHILFQNFMGSRATDALQHIGFLEEDLIKACTYIDPNDIRRWYGVSLNAARAFSGLGKIAEYLALLTLSAFKDNVSRGFLPVTISDVLDRCLSFDNSWSEGSPFMRVIRSPFSLHKKNREKYGMVHQQPLVDVVGAFFDGTIAIEETNIDMILGCMWDLEKAADHAQRFSGIIPCSNDTLIDLIGEYKASDLFGFHQEFDRQEDRPRGAALDNAKREVNIPDVTRNMLDDPNPSALQPQKMIGMVYDFLIRAHWKPRHIANILRDLYQNPMYHWTQDFFKYPADTKANFWARTLSAVVLWQTGRLNI